jgi:hypothetical protein
MAKQQIADQGKCVASRSSANVRGARFTYGCSLSSATSPISIFAIAYAASAIAPLSSPHAQ